MTLEKDGYIADAARTVVVEPSSPLAACLAAHHEHTLVVTRNGPVLLTAA